MACEPVDRTGRGGTDMAADVVVRFLRMEANAAADRLRYNAADEQLLIIPFRLVAGRIDHIITAALLLP
ncbi:hypothetical protein N0M98_05635 [Paenibacillus doosanensis]|uniref:hypothetical protein n=1 Tax=Paenibacillus doosanensis TaxID=1229154 RepID=UPI00217FE03E|nr:hypothetical protein [Paenibacillus doosanensis]MCS7459617.1 hypothetical protein [Paenibacillus doosanensis]